MTEEERKNKKGKRKDERITGREGNDGGREKTGEKRRRAKAIIVKWGWKSEGVGRLIGGRFHNRDTASEAEVGKIHLPHPEIPCHISLSPI